MNILAHMDKTRLFLIIRKPGKVAKVDTDHDPGPEARLLTHIPPSSAHPHLDSFLGGHSVFFFFFKFVSYHNFPVVVGQKLEDPLEDLRWQCAVDTTCGHFGLTL